MKNSLLIIFAVAFAVCLFLVVRDCNDSPDAEIDRLKGEVAEKDKQIERRDAQLKIKNEALEEIKEDYEEKISELNGAIDSANTIIENVTVESDARLEDLEKKDSELTDYKDKYENMTAQRDEWKNKFTLVVREKDSVIASAQKKFEEERDLRETTEIVLSDHKIALVERDDALASRDELIESLEKKLRTRNRWRTLERLAFLSLSGVLLYGAIS